MTKVCFFGCFARFIGTRLVYIDGDDIKYSKSGESIGLIWKKLHESFIRSYYKMDCFLCVPLFFSDRNNETAVEIRFIATLSVFRWWNFVLTLRRSDLLFFCMVLFSWTGLKRIRGKYETSEYITSVILFYVWLVGIFVVLQFMNVCFFLFHRIFFFCFPFLNYLQHATEIIQRRKTELFWNYAHRIIENVMNL